MDLASLKTRFRIAAPLLRKLAGFWSWWITELGGLLPQRVRTTLLPRVERLYLQPGDQEVIASRITAETFQELGRYPLTAGALSDAKTGEIQDLAGRAREVVLCLPPDRVLVKTLALPAAAEENLREVLGFEMDRQTPFTVDQVYYDYRLSRHPSKQSTLGLKLVVTPRPFLDELLGRLRELGFQPHQATLCGEKSGQPLPINLIPVEDRYRRQDSARHFNLALGALAVVLLLAAIALPLVNKLQAIQALESRIEVATDNAEITRRLHEEVERLDTDSRFLVNKKQATPLVLELINELTHILPDDTWLNRLDLKRGEVQIQGQSASAAALIPLIESSEILHNPRFRSPVTKAPRLNIERFHLSADITTEPAP